MAPDRGDAQVSRGRREPTLLLHDHSTIFSSEQFSSQKALRARHDDRMTAAEARQPVDASHHEEERLRLRAQLEATAVAETANHERDDTAVPGLSDNTSVFGKILRGHLPARILYEDSDVLCFKYIAPVSDTHNLVIPKRHIENEGHCRPSDLPLLEHMENVALKVLMAEYPDMGSAELARSERRLSLGYHVWPMISVPHLHLHCIYPMPCTKWWSRVLLARVIHPRDYGPFYVSSKETISRLHSGSKS
jgi:histidine triad (HIT) family protein